MYRLDNIQIFLHPVIPEGLNQGNYCHHEDEKILVYPGRFLKLKYGALLLNKICAKKSNLNEDSYLIILLHVKAPCIGSSPRFFQVLNEFLCSYYIHVVPSMKLR